MGNRLVTYLCLWAGPGGTESGPLLLAFSACVRISLAVVVQAIRVPRPVRTVSGDKETAVRDTVLGRAIMWSSSCLSRTRGRLGLC